MPSAGSRVGAGPMGEAERGEAAPRIRVSFWCANSHETRPSFATRCGGPRDTGTAPAAASRPAGTRPTPRPAAREPYKTHLAYVKERRTDSDGAAILAEALDRLAARLDRRRPGPRAQSTELAPPAAGVPAGARPPERPSGRSLGACLRGPARRSRVRVCCQRAPAGDPRSVSNRSARSLAETVADHHPDDRRVGEIRGEGVGGHQPAAGAQPLGQVEHRVSWPAGPRS